MISPAHVVVLPILIPLIAGAIMLMYDERQRRLKLGIGVLVASGVWLTLRPRTFQVIIGLALLSYGVNLFIFAMGRLVTGAAPIMPKGGFVDPDAYADPVPQALVLTAIVISFATTALFLVVIMAARGLTGTDHVDGRERDQ